MSLDQHRRQQQQQQQYAPYHHQTGTSWSYKQQREIGGRSRPGSEDINSNNDNPRVRVNNNNNRRNNSAREVDTRNSFGSINHRRGSAIQDPLSPMRSVSGSNSDTPFQRQHQGQTQSYLSQKDGQDSIINFLRAELQARDVRIEFLESELSTLRALLFSNIQPLNKQQGQTDLSLSSALIKQEQQFQIPRNIELILEKLSNSLISKEAKLKATGDTLEALLTSLALNPTNSLTQDGRYDVEAISHKILNRLEILTNENREMGRMLSYGRSQEMLISMNLLRMENDELKKEVADLEKQLGKGKKEEREE